MIDVNNPLIMCIWKTKQKDSIMLGTELAQQWMLDVIGRK